MADVADDLRKLDDENNELRQENRQLTDEVAELRGEVSALEEKLEEALSDFSDRAAAIFHDLMRDEGLLTDPKRDVPFSALETEWRSKLEEAAGRCG